MSEFRVTYTFRGPPDDVEDRGEALLSAVDTGWPELGPVVATHLNGCYDLIIALDAEDPGEAVRETARTYEAAGDPLVAVCVVEAD